MYDIVDKLSCISYNHDMNDRTEYDIEIYATETGEEPFNEWLDSIKDKVTKRTVYLRVQRLRQGNFGYCKSLKNGLHELKIDYGSGLRIYFANVGDKLLLLLGGGNKQSQEGDIDKCKSFLEEYRRSNNGKKS
jgi:putative addiction module killer protein